MRTLAAELNNTRTAKRVKVELSPTRALKIAKVAEANGQSMGEAVASLLARSVGHAAAGTSRRTRTGRARTQDRRRKSQGARFSVALTGREVERVKEAARREELLDGLTLSEIAHHLLVTFADCHLGGEA